jgi:DNA-binding NarL/FixJ family response regulator
MANIQVNLRVPEKHKDLLQDVTKRLRGDDAFADRLRELLEAGAAETDPDVQRQLQALFARVQALEERLGAGSAPTAGEGDRTVAAEASAWTTGEGRSRRLTAAGRAEVDRRIAAGESDKDIAEAVGVRRNAVHNRRKKHRSQDDG